VNPQGHKTTLVAQQFGNTNAVKSGIYSNRLIDARASEITDELAEAGPLGLIGGLAVKEAAKCIALLEMIDEDLAERGVVDKKGNPRSLLDLRAARFNATREVARSSSGRSRQRTAQS
jgi:hypothetical protein